jgi:hypothetical protein
MDAKERKTFIARLEEFCKQKQLVEIITPSREATGYITEVGEDFLGVTFSITKEITKQVPKEGGGTDTEKHIIVTELEVLIRYKNIDSVSRIKKQVTK